MVRQEQSEKIEAAILRTQEMHITDPSKFFKNVFFQQRAFLDALTTNGTLVTDPKEVAKIIHKFYQEEIFGDSTRSTS